MKHFFAATLMSLGLFGSGLTISAQSAGTHRAVPTKTASMKERGKIRSGARANQGLRTTVRHAKDRPSGSGHFNERGGPPPNDDCSGAITLTPDPACVPIAGDVTGATQSIAAITCGPYTGDADDDVWYKFVATATSHTIQVDGSTDFDAVVDLRSGACNGTNIACADATVEDGVETIAAAGLTAGSTYYIRVYHYYTGAAPTTGFTICVIDAGPAPYNDECADAVPHALAVPGSVTVTGDNTGATDSEGVGYGTTWEQFTISSCANVTIDYCGTTPAFGNFFISLTVGCPFTSVIDAATNVDCGDGNFVMTWPGLAAGTYYVPVLMEPGVSVGPYTIEISTTSCGAGPANDNCGSVAFTPLSVGGTITFTGDNTTATATGDYVTGTMLDDGNSGSVWHGFTTTTCTNLMVEYCGLAPTWDNVWIVLSLDCPADDDLVFNSSFNTTDCPDGNVTIYYDNLPAGSYYFPVMLDAANDAVGPYTIDLTATACAGGPPNEDCGDAISLPVNPPGGCPGAAVNGDNTAAAVEMIAPACDAGTTGWQDVWYSFNSGSNNEVFCDLTIGTIGDIGIELFDACGGTSLFCDFSLLTYTLVVIPGTDYWIRVFSNNDFGMGGTFTICLSSGAGTPPNDNCGSVAFTPLSVGSTITFTGDNTTATATGDYVTGTMLDDGNSGSVWHGFTTTTCTNLMVEYCGLAPTWDNAWIVLTLDCPADDDLVFNSSFNTTDCPDGNVTIYYDNLPAGSYYFPVLLDAANNAVGPYSIDLTATACTGGPLNDDCADAVPVYVELVADCPANAITGDNTGATDDGGLNTCDLTGSALDVWYTFNSLTNTTVTIDLAPVGGGTMTDWAFVVWDACGGAEVFCAVAPPGPLDVTVVPGTDYVVQVYSNPDFGLPGEFTLCISGAVSTGTGDMMSGELTVFPNPGNGELNIISASATGTVIIELFDVTGRTVHAEHAQLTAGSAHAIMPAGRLTQGTYTLRLSTDAGSTSRRVVVN